MKIVIPGGSGHVGRILTKHFLAFGHEIIVLSRSNSDVKKNEKGLTVLSWDAKNLDDWANEIDGADAVINLAGRSVNCRYNEENRRIITESRTKSTQVVGEAIANSKNPPPLWMQMSTATIYAHRYDAPNNESDGIIGGSEPNVPETWNFSISVAKSWEKVLREAPVPESTRKVVLRLSIVMAPEKGGVFEVLLRLVKLGLGGKQGNGKQYVSWITDIDLIRAIDFIMENQNLTGPVNLASPNPVPNALLMKEIRNTWGMPIGLPASEWMLELGAIPLQTETELILKSRRVTPGKLLDAGFKFEQPDWKEAVNDLCRRVKES